MSAHLFSDNKDMDNSTITISSTANDLNEINDINRKDEDALLNLFSECDYATSNVDKFIDKLQAELINLETVSGKSERGRSE